MAPDFEKANEIYFRLGIIYKQQQKFSNSLDVWIDEKAFVLIESLLIISSASSISSTTLLALLLRRIFGSRLATFMNSRRTYVMLPPLILLAGTVQILTASIVRIGPGCLPTSVGP